MNSAEPVTDPSGAPTHDERTWGMAAHLAALVGFLVPFGNILGPLIVWLVKREHSAFVAAHAKEAMNFNITVAIGALLCAILVQFSIGVLFGAALLIYWLIMTIIAALKANEGEVYRYRFTLRLVK